MLRPAVTLASLGNFSPSRWLFLNTCSFANFAYTQFHIEDQIDSASPTSYPNYHVLIHHAVSMRTAQHSDTRTGLDVCARGGTTISVLCPSHLFLESRD